MLKTYIVSAKKDGAKQWGALLLADSPEQAIERAKEYRPEQCAGCALSVALDQGFEGCKGCEEALFADDICPDCGNFVGVN